MSLNNWQYTVGLSKEEVSEESLKVSGFNYHKIIVKEALENAIEESMQGKYKNPSSMREDAPEYFSCSSLVSFLYTRAGAWMPSISIDKYVFGKPVEEGDIKFGDLIFSNSGEGKIYFETVEYLKGTKVLEGIDHVGMYLGDGKVLHATKRLGRVVAESLKEFSKHSKVIGFRRITDINEERFVVEIPEDRVDLRSKENLLKEICK